MEKSEIGDRRFTDARGTTYIAPSKRADGSWRKERRVKPGYVPPEEVAAYKAPGMKVHSFAFCNDARVHVSLVS